MRGLEQSHSSLQQLIKVLQAKEEEEAAAILQRLRQGIEVNSLLELLQAGDQLIQVHARPETRLHFEFPYRRQMPTALFTSNNPYLASTMYKSINTALIGDTTLQSGSGSTENSFHPSPYVKPYALATIVDPRFAEVTPSRWTDVLVDDDFCRMLLKLYFQYEHQFSGSFQKDLFLDDMISGSTTFCSKLLVNAILALACVRISSVFKLISLFLVSVSNLCYPSNRTVARL